MTRRLGALAGALTVLLALAGPGLSSRAPAVFDPAAPGHSTIVRLLIATPVRAEPSSSSRLITVLAASGRSTGQQTALPVIGDPVPHRVWWHVRLPGRPNGATGWVQGVNVRLDASLWRVVVVRRARTASVWHEGKLYGRYLVVVGKPSTPTPAGHFFIVEHVRQQPGSQLGPWALATSAHSNVLQEFDGGSGQIAMHGRAGALADDPLGSAASHGCIRFDNAVVALLAGKLPNGTPVEIV